jgi:CheY-like chemotaxis protein
MAVDRQPHLTGTMTQRMVPPENSATPAFAHAKILVVDDEQSVRDAVARTLRRQGYDVVCAESGEAALEVVATADSRHFDLLISDVVMPGMSGVDLAAKLRAGDASLELLLVSGYPGKHLDNQTLALKQGDLLQKPFTPKQLTIRVQQKIARIAARRPLDRAHA